jgi:hypothetical protein
MHAYHYRELALGYANPDILALYRQAMARSLFPAGAWMMQNVEEYFAAVATAFLYDSPPAGALTRERLRAIQPDCYAWLTKEFGG